MKISTASSIPKVNLPFTAHRVVQGVEATRGLDGLPQVADDSLSDPDLDSDKILFILFFISPAVEQYWSVELCIHRLEISVP